MARSRIRTRIDAGRLRELIRGPGADTRTWVFFARVLDTDTAVRWDAELGWLVDVTIVGGQLDGEGPVPCRVAWCYAGDGVGVSEPVERGVHVVGIMPEADLNGTPVIVGMLSTPDFPAPTTVNGEDVDADFAKATHLRKSARNFDAQFGSLWRAAATDDARLLAQAVKLADDDASQSYVRGEDFADALERFLDATDQFAQAGINAFSALDPGGLPITPVTAANARAALLAWSSGYFVFLAEIEAFKQARQQYLSTRIDGV